MDGLTVTAPVTARLTWDYDPRLPRLADLYERGKRGQWDAGADLDWNVPVEFGAPLPADSGFARAAFGSSSLSRYGPELWDAFRWEFQVWMVSQFLHGEQGALVAAARLVEVASGVEAKCCLAGQVADEARHVEVFSRYLREKTPGAYPVSPALAALLADALDDPRWDVTALGMQIMVEALAMAAFRLADKTFHDDLIRSACRLVARDEARHVSYGVIALREVYGGLTSAELAEREEFALEAARLMSRRFLLEDVWERLGVPVGEGVRFARENELMIRYRQAVFAKVVSSLAQAGLLTPRVRAGFGDLGLLGYAGGRLAGSGGPG
ncbi:ferritin-like domain-containing protein [Bailinhaonella thermotolerans]|uniref:Ferritin-like domain-containing protein n=1 Tax=Bailinhaonella thermotolerans TaxID=1070861 RepID=A0A3A4B013_9ACTN|nr:ferritin-like domain-containing protein [Bailinhaonella thermotolerans]RJL27238.1 ferritin-like domain-containing protein [Bailinhaonella thermotolerans]